MDGQPKRPPIRSAAALLVCVALFILLGLCFLVADDDSNTILPYGLLAGVALLAPLLSNLVSRSRLAAFLAGPVLVSVGFFFSVVQGSKAIGYLPTVIPIIVVYTAPFWVLSWMISDRLRTPGST